MYAISSVQLERIKEYRTRTMKIIKMQSRASILRPLQDWMTKQIWDRYECCTDRGHSTQGITDHDWCCRDRGHSNSRHQSDYDRDRGRKARSRTRSVSPEEGEVASPSRERSREKNRDRSREKPRRASSDHKEQSLKEHYEKLRISRQRAHSPGPSTRTQTSDTKQPLLAKTAQPGSVEAIQEIESMKDEPKFSDLKSRARTPDLEATRKQREKDAQDQEANRFSKFQQRMKVSNQILQKRVFKFLNQWQIRTICIKYNVIAGRDNLVSNASRVKTET